MCHYAHFIIKIPQFSVIFSSYPSSASGFCNRPASQSSLILQFTKVCQTKCASFISSLNVTPKLKRHFKKWSQTDEIFDFSTENINIFLWWSHTSHLGNQSTIIETLSDTESNVRPPPPPTFLWCRPLLAADTAHTVHEPYTWAIKHAGEGLQTNDRAG